MNLALFRRLDGQDPRNNHPDFPRQAQQEPDHHETQTDRVKKSNDQLSFHIIDFWTKQDSSSFLGNTNAQFLIKM